MRNNKGQFVKGFRNSIATEFKPGEHWRKPQMFRDQDWLHSAYVVDGRSSGDLAKEFNVSEEAIIYWLRKHNIARRSISDARGIKKWGSSGKMNGMFNKKGPANPRWQGGITPERQSFYVSMEWKAACREVWKRDNATCQRCSAVSSPETKLHVHHIAPFRFKELRAVVSNLVLLCKPCHNFVHSKKNTQREYLQQS